MVQFSGFCLGLPTSTTGVTRPFDELEKISYPSKSEALQLVVLNQDPSAVTYVELKRRDEEV